MTKIREYAKAITALIGALATFLVTVGAPPEWAAYLGSIGTILTGLATFGVPNLPSITAAEQTVTSLQQVQSQLDAAHQTASNNLNSITQQAINSVSQIQQAIGGVAGQVPVLGPLAQQVIDSLRLP